MKQPINEESAKKVAIVILIVTAILNFFGILCIIGFATKKIEIVKAEENTEYNMTIPQTIAYSTYTTMYNNGTQVNNNNTALLTTTYNNIEYSITYMQATSISGNTKKRIIFNINNQSEVIYITYEFTLDVELFEPVIYSSQTLPQTEQELIQLRWTINETNRTYLENNNAWVNGFSIFFQETGPQIIQLTTPTITKNGYVVEWQAVEHAEYYNIFRNGNLHGQTQINQWICSENGTYTIQACTTEEEYSNSEISNSVSITEYNDIIGNGWNFYTLIGAVLDSEIILFKSLLNYEIWGINLFQAVQIILTGCLVLLIIKKFVL